MKSKFSLLEIYLKQMIQRREKTVYENIYSRVIFKTVTQGSITTEFIV